jgi:hypothetical protein
MRCLLGFVCLFLAGIALGNEGDSIVVKNGNSLTGYCQKTGTIVYDSKNIQLSAAKKVFFGGTTQYFDTSKQLDKIFGSKIKTVISEITIARNNLGISMVGEPKIITTTWKFNICCLIAIFFSCLFFLFFARAIIEGAWLKRITITLIFSATVSYFAAIFTCAGNLTPAVLLLSFLTIWLSFFVLNVLLLIVFAKIFYIILVKNIANN